MRSFLQNNNWLRCFVSASSWRPERNERNKSCCCVEKKKPWHFTQTNLSLFCHLRLMKWIRHAPWRRYDNCWFFPHKWMVEMGPIHHTSCLTGIFIWFSIASSLYTYVCNSSYSTLCATQIEQNKKIEWILFVFLPFLFLFVWIWIVLFLFKSILVRIQMEANAFSLILFQSLVSIKNFVFWFTFQCLQNTKIQQSKISVLMNAVNWRICSEKCTYSTVKNEHHKWTVLALCRNWFEKCS